MVVTVMVEDEGKYDKEICPCVLDGLRFIMGMTCVISNKKRFFNH